MCVHQSCQLQVTHGLRLEAALRDLCGASKIKHFVTRCCQTGTVVHVAELVSLPAS